MLKIFGPKAKKLQKILSAKVLIAPPDIKLWWLYKFRFVIGSAILLFFILGVGTAVSPLVRSFNPGALINLNSQQTNTTNPKIIIRKPIFYSQRSRSGDSPNSSIVKPANYQNGPELVLKYFQNPILLALTSQQLINSTSEPISQKPVLSSQPYSSGNHPSLVTIKPAKHQNEPETGSKYSSESHFAGPGFSEGYKLQNRIVSLRSRYGLLCRSTAKTTRLHLPSNLQNIKMNLNRFPNICRIPFWRP